MDKSKIDAAVLVMQGLTPEERAIVAYTVEREARKRGRKTNSKNHTLPLEDQRQALMDEAQ